MHAYAYFAYQETLTHGRKSNMGVFLFFLLHLIHAQMHSLPALGQANVNETCIKRPSKKKRKTPYRERERGPFKQQQGSRKI